MQRPIQRRIALLLLCFLLLQGSLGGNIRQVRAGSIKLDPNIRVQPVLQYGAQADPEKVVRVIVQKYADKPADNAALAKLVKGTNLNTLGFINGFSLELPQGKVLALGKDQRVKYVSYDGALKGQGLAESTTTALTATAVTSKQLKTTYPFTTKATDVWNGTTIPQATGNGVQVALIDTGVFTLHPDLWANLTCAAVSPPTSSSTTYTATVGCDERSAFDFYGHGTHTAGIISGRSFLGGYIGVAPDSALTSVRITNEVGQFTEADLLRGLQYVYDHRWTTTNPDGIRILNLSVSTAIPDSATVSPVSAAVERLWFAGVTVVVAAGNRGAAADAVWYAPANNPYVITVGCSDEQGTASPTDDTLCDFSSRGITQDGYAKPDLLAPGRRIVSTLAVGSVLADDPAFAGRIVDYGYFRLSGTSMSAPMVAGTAALLLERYPTLTPDQLKSLLIATTQPLTSQPRGNPGLVQADKAMVAARAGQYPPRAVAALPAKVAQSATSKSSTLLAAYWDSAYWDNAYWDNAYWDNAYWDCAYWD